MIEIEVRNFQSIEHTSIRLDGFTALVGRSNIGKSALVRAVKAALTGAPVTNLVRHNVSCPRRTRNAKSCGCTTVVRIKADGFDLTWEKGDAVNRYEFNGSTYDKVAQGTPDFLQQFFAPVKVGDEKTLLQVADQFTPIFLLDQTGTAVADVLSDVARLDHINLAMRNVEKDRREAVTTRKVREKDVLELETQLTEYDGLDATVERAEDTQKRFSEVRLAHGGITQLECYIRAQQSLEADTRMLDDATSVPLKDIGDLYSQQVAYTQLGQFYARFAERAVVIRALTGVNTVSIPEAEPVQKGAQTLERLNVWASTLYEFQRWFDARKAADKTSIPDLPSFPETLKRFEWLQQAATKAASLTKAVNTLAAEATQAEQTEAEILQEFAAIGVCPTCAQAIHPSPH